MRWWVKSEWEEDILFLSGLIINTENLRVEASNVIIIIKLEMI